MRICTFFGHRDCPDTVAETLYHTLEQIIRSGQADTFLIGHQGKFDLLAAQTLVSLKEQYPFIQCTIVLAYLPSRQENYPFETLYPEGLELVPRKFAISHRNQWLVQHSDMVVTYITHD